MVVLDDVLVLLDAPLTPTIGATFGRCRLCHGCVNRWRRQSKALDVAVERRFADTDFISDLWEWLFVPLRCDDAKELVTPYDSHNSCTPFRTDSASGNALMSAVNVL